MAERSGNPLPSGRGAVTEHSSNLASIACQSPVIKAQIEIAEARLRMQISRELLQLGVLPSQDRVDAILKGIPDDIMARLLAL